MLIYDPMAGESITKTISEAMVMAKDKQQSVQFTFNGAVVIVKPGDTSDAVHSAWRKETDRLHDEYVNSDGYKQSQKEMSQRIANAQAKIDELIPQLPDILAGGNVGMLLEWLSTYTENADYIGVEKHLPEVITQLVVNGKYARNAYVGKKDNWDSQSSAEYIIGQFIDIGPCPYLTPFVEKWMKQYA